MIPLDLTVWKCYNCTKALKTWPSHFIHFEILFQKGEEDSESSEIEDSDLSIDSSADGDDDDGQETNDAEAMKDENYEEKEEAELRQVERIY